MKVCGRCREERPSTEFRWRSGRSGALHSYCKLCHNATSNKPWKERPATSHEYNRLYNGSTPGAARGLRHIHGMTRELSEHWAAILMNPGSRCAVCGVPNYVIKTYREKGWPFFLGKRHGRGSAPRLTLDHIVPGCNKGGFRPLCKLCNSLRGAATMTDEEVLIVVREKWQWFTGPRFLWWLNTSPGVGGRLHRSERCQKRDVQYASGATEQPIPSPTTTPTPSPSPPASATSVS